MTTQQNRTSALDRTRLTRRRFTGGTVGLGAAALAASAGVGPHGAAAQETTGGTLRLPLNDSTNTDLNPIGIRTLGAFYLQSCIYDGLVCSSPSWDEVEPALAESWEISEDGLTYTFHLRQGVNWHDGAPCTAHDVAFTYKTILTKDVGSYMANALLTIAGAQAYFDGESDGIEGIQVVDDATIQFVLTEPTAPFAYSILTVHSIIPAHVWQDVSIEDLTKPGTWETGQIGTGPFKFSEYVPDQYLELVRHDDAWRGAPKLDRVLFVHTGTTPEAIAAALEAGDLDYAPIPANEFDRLSGVSTLRVASKPVYNVRLLNVNCAKPYLQDKRVRQAFAHAIDRAGICEAILTNMSAPIDTVTPSETWRNANATIYPYDPEAARALLAEAGWDPNQEVEVSLYYQDQLHQDAMSIIQQQLNEAGVKASVLQLEGSAIQSYYFEDGEFDMMLAGYGVSPDMDEFREIFSSNATWPNGQNAMRYANPEVDELFNQGRATADLAERKAIYDEVQVILADELPTIPFYQLQLIAGFNTRVQNGEAIFNVWNRPYNWNIEQVSVSDGA